MSPPIDLREHGEALLALFKQVQQQALEQNIEAALAGEPGVSLNRQGFAVVPIALASSAFQRQGVLVNQTGYGFHVLRRSSPAGVRLNVKVGGETQYMGPGDVIRGKFEGLQIQQGQGSVLAGTAYCLVELNPQGRFEQSPAAAGDVSAPQVLLGSMDSLGAITFSAEQAENTDPSGAASGIVTAFDVTGYSKLQLMIDTLSAAANATSFDLIPWWQTKGGSTVWFEQGTERISVPDTDTSGGRYRIVELPLDGGAGYMYFSIRNLLATARTGLSFFAVGLE